MWTEEVRTFKMHENLLYHIIERQAGSIEKAWLEGVMNSIDSGAERIDIYIDRHTSLIKDDGKGMNEEEIKNYFEIFGYPIKANEKKRYGEFRMGRGQLFAQGRNIWKTQDNVLEVDIKRLGIRYILRKSDEWVDGCIVEVFHYNSLTTHEKEEKARRLEKWIRYVPAEVTINGKVVTQDIKKLFKGEGKYYFETSSAKYGFDDMGRGINIYNQGIFVKTIWNQGIGGDINSKKRLKVNFARNDIMYYCPVWNKIQKELLEFRMEILSKKANKSMTDENRIGIANLMLKNEEAKNKFYNAKIFRTSNESWVSLSDLEGKLVSFAKIGDVRADQIMQRIGIIFLDEEFTIGNLRDLIEEVVEGIIPYEQATSTYSSEFKIVRKSELNLRQRRNLEIAKYFAKISGINRKILPATRCCTDSKRVILLGVDELNLPTPEFLTTGIYSIIHEFSHDSDTRFTDVHGESFFKNFHENIFELGHAISKTIEKFSWEMNREREGKNFEVEEKSLLKKLFKKIKLKLKRTKIN